MANLFKNTLFQRIVTDAIMFVAVFVLPWWLLLPLGLVIALRFYPYWELIIYGFIFDSLYNVSEVRFHFIQFLATILAVVIVVITTTIMNRLRLR